MRGGATIASRESNARELSGWSRHSVRRAQAPPLTDPPEAAGAEADRAMDWPRQASAAGYKHMAHAAKDADLGVLRDRPNFRELLTGLEAGKY